jgi:hypothetical protein
MALQSLAVIDKREKQLEDIVRVKDTMFPAENPCMLEDIYHFDDFFNNHLADFVNDEMCKAYVSVFASRLFAHILIIPYRLILGLGGVCRVFQKKIEHEDLKNWINTIRDDR